MISMLPDKLNANAGLWQEKLVVLPIPRSCHLGVSEDLWELTRLGEKKMTRITVN